MGKSIWKTLLTLNLLLLVSEGAQNTAFEMEETSCSFQRNGSCYIQMTLTVLEKNVSFTVNYTNTNGDSHQVLDCAWLPVFKCIKGPGFSYSPPINETFDIYIDQRVRCLNGGVFTIVFDQDTKRRCQKDLSDQSVSQDRPKCNIYHNLTGQTPTTASGVECPSTTPGEDSTPPLSGDQENLTGIAIGIPVLVVVVFGVIMAIFCYRKRCLKKRDQERPRDHEGGNNPSELETFVQNTTSPVSEASQHNS